MQPGTIFARLSRLQRLGFATLALALVALLTLPIQVGSPLYPVGLAVRVLTGGLILTVWAVLNLPARKPPTGRVIVGIAPFAEAVERQTQRPRRSLLQRLRPSPRWEPVLDEEGATVLPLPEGGLELADFLTYQLGKTTAPIPEVTLVALPYVDSEATAIALGREIGAQLVLWGRTRRSATAPVRFAPRLTITRRVEPQVSASDLRLCGVQTVELPVQQLRVWRDRYLGLQHLQSLILGVIFYAYGADEEALNELAAVRVAPASTGTPDPAIAAAQLLSGNLQVLNEQWPAATTTFNAVRETPAFQPAAMTNLGVLFALQGDTARALDQLALAVQQAPKLALAHHNLAVLQQRFGRPAEAEQHFGAAMELDPSSAKATAALRRLLGPAASPPRPCARCARRWLRSPTMSPCAATSPPS